MCTVTEVKLRVHDFEAKIWLKRAQSREHKSKTERRFHKGKKAELHPQAVTCHRKLPLHHNQSGVKANGTTVTCDSSHDGARNK